VEMHKQVSMFFSFANCICHDNVIEREKEREKERERDEYESWQCMRRCKSNANVVLSALELLKI
jgi:hypothetical protein